MSDLIAQIDLTNWKQLLLKINGRSKKLIELLRALYSTMGHKDIISHFRNEEGPDGKWQKRKTSTQERYRRISIGELKPPRGASRAQFNPSNKLLQMTGNMRNSILPANAKKLTEKSILIYANSEYSKPHDLGDPSRGLPKRSFMWFSDDTLKNMAEGAASWVLGESV